MKMIARLAGLAAAVALLGGCMAGLGGVKGPNYAVAGVGVVPTSSASQACSVAPCYPAQPQYAQAAPGGGTDSSGLRGIDSAFLIRYGQKSQEFRGIEGEMAARADHPEAARIADLRRANAYREQLEADRQYPAGQMSWSNSYAIYSQGLPYQRQPTCGNTNPHHSHDHNRCYRLYQGR